MSNIFDENELNTAFGDWGNQFQGRLTGIKISKVLPMIREIIKNSIDRNFSEGGRYGEENPYGGGSFQWKKSKRAIRQGGQTLVDTSALKKSIQVKVIQIEDGIKIITGSNLPYAAIHQFGFDGTVTVKQHTRKIKSRNVKKSGKKGKVIAMGFAYVKEHTKQMTIDERPYLVLQDEDIEQITDLLVTFYVNTLLK